MIRGLIFDFDGLILDTEGPIFQSWQELYQDHGCEISMEGWGKILGTAQGTFNLLDDLERLAGRVLDREVIASRRRKRELDLIAAQPVMPGVPNYLQAAKKLSLKVGLASSSSCAWVTGHLSHLGLLEFFDCIQARDDVERTKPDPELYLAVLSKLSLQADQAVAFEDSPNGILAAKQAGLFCVAVPNPLTRQFSLDRADFCLDSLADMPLKDLLSKVEELRNGQKPGI